MLDTDVCDKQMRFFLLQEQSKDQQSRGALVTFVKQG